MTLFETAAKLQLRLDAANEEDAVDQLLTRSQKVRTALTSAAEHFEAVQSYRIALGQADVPPLGRKEIRQAVGRLKGSLSRYGPKALQLQSADTLQRLLSTQIRRVDGWVRLTWRQNFAAAQELLVREKSGELHGSPVDRVRASNRASKIKVVQGKDPVRERTLLEELLKVEGLRACLGEVDKLVDELRAAMAAIDKKQAALTPRVRAVLQQAASVNGLPLLEVTPGLLDELQLAGVLEDLVVRACD